MTPHTLETTVDVDGIARLDHVLSVQSVEHLRGQAGGFETHAALGDGLAADLHVAAVEEHVAIKADARDRLAEEAERTARGDEDLIALALQAVQLIDRGLGDGRVVLAEGVHQRAVDVEEKRFCHSLPFVVSIAEDCDRRVVIGAQEGLARHIKHMQR